jgi:tetratricopeptide (TPR) repeat protein
MTDEVLKLACRGCGASLEYSANEQSLRCQYCGTLTEIPKPEEKLADAAQTIVPLTVDVTALTDAVYEHLASGDLTPDHLLEHATFTKTERFYVPVYGFTGEYEARWTASFGYDRQESYTVYETRTENGRSRQVPVTKTRTVTDWRPVNGTDSGSFGVLGYAGARLLAEKADAVSLVEQGSVAALTEFNDSYTAGIPSEEFAATEHDVYDRRANPQIGRIIERGVHQHAQGDRQKDWHWTSSITKQSMTALIPLCHAIYEFEGKSYNVWVSGADAGRLVSDPLPVDQNRKRALHLGFAPLAAAVAGAGVACWQFGAPLAIPAASVGVAALFGYIRRKSIIGHSRQLRQALLATRRAAAANTAAMSQGEQAALVNAAQRPNKPWLANTAKDMVVLPALSVAFAAIAFVQLVPVGSSHTSQETAQSAPSPQVVYAPAQVAAPAAAPAPTVATAPVSEPVASAPTPSSSESAVAAAGPASTPTAATTPAPAAEPTPAQTAKQTATVSPIPAMLQLAKAGDWQGVDQQLNTLHANRRDRPVGDINLRKTSNAEGLQALRRDDYASAVQAFERGARADSSNIEVRNNYGYALLKAGRNDDAVRVLADVLLDAPDRTSAWANLAEATSSNQEVSAAALKLAVRFSSNRERTTSVLTRLSETHPDARYRAVIASVLPGIDSIPSAGPQQASRLKFPAPAVGGEAQPPRTEGLVQQIVDDGQACFKSKQYACAITNATNALRLKPDSQPALQLKTSAEAAQAQTLHNIQIK